MTDKENEILEDDGERMIPHLHKGRSIYGDHIARYHVALDLVKNKVVLDIASGSGYGTKMLSANAKFIYGVDVSEDAIKYSKKKYPAKNIQYLIGDGEQIPLDDNSIDVAVSCETIEHIADYKKFLKEIKRVLKPNGLFLLSTPNDLEYPPGNHFHLHEFNRQELTLLVDSFFSYQKQYYQTKWQYNTILPADLQLSEWEQAINTLNTVALNEDQCVYFFTLCSDIKISEELKPLGTISEHYRLMDEQASNIILDNLRKDNAKLEKRYFRAKSDKADIANRMFHVQKELDTIKSSRSWKTITRANEIRSGLSRSKKDNMHTPDEK